MKFFFADSCFQVVLEKIQLGCPSGNFEQLQKIAKTWNGSYDYDRLQQKKI